jgi:hypothetical protein
VRAVKRTNMVEKNFIFWCDGLGGFVWEFGGCVNVLRLEHIFRLMF